MLAHPCPETATVDFCQYDSCPLLIDMHGRGVSVELQDDLSDYPRITDEDHVILVHPEGIGWGWNFGWCCSEEDDVGFLLKLIDTLIENRSADGDRVYMTGWSNGCYMSQEMASVASNRITAIACMAGYTEEPVHPDYSAVPIMEIHGPFGPAAALRPPPQHPCKWLGHLRAMRGRYRTCTGGQMPTIVLESHLT